MTTIPSISADDAKWRQVEKINPGYWVLMEYEHNETGEETKIWSQVVMRLSLEQRDTGRKVEQLRGNDAGGYGWDFSQYRGFQMLSLTEAQGKKAGLSIPAEPARPNSPENITTGPDLAPEEGSTGNSAA